MGSAASRKDVIAVKNRFSCIGRENNDNLCTSRNEQEAAT